MSGSIGGNRILREQVRPTVNGYIKDVLSEYPNYKKCDITGSYNAGIKKDHGDIDLVILIDAKEELKEVKKRFKEYIESLPNNITPPFRLGKNKGSKAQLYGSIVTCEYPIKDKKEDYVQIDNIITTNEDEYNFQKSFLNLNAQKQTLITGLVRIQDNESKEKLFDYFNITELPKLETNQEFEFVLSVSGLSLRKITLSSDRKQAYKEEIWRSHKWDNVEYLLREWDLTKSYEELLYITEKVIKDDRSRSRICGIMKSMINIGPGEKGTQKGIDKENGIKLAFDILKPKGIKL